MTRSAEIAEFLEREGWGGALSVALAGDASARSYARLWRGTARAILMDMPPASGLGLAPYCAIAAWLRDAGFNAPEVLAADHERGLALIEDLGDDLLARLCEASPAQEAELYTAAIDLIADLQRAPLPKAARGWTPHPYDATVLAREAQLAIEWYLPAATGQSVSADAAGEFVDLAAAGFAPALAAPPVPVLRDYHAENLLWLPERRGHECIGLLDFQDLLIGHPAYDLVSLLQDARRDVSDPLREAMMARYLRRSSAESSAFLRDAHALSAQRNLKIIGLFARLCLRDGKPRYLGYLPRVWKNLERDLAHPDLAKLQSWIQRHVPPPEPTMQARMAGGCAA